jgi:hypothetical protein
VQLLEFERLLRRAAAREAMDRRDRVRVVRGEHRIDRIRRVEHAARVREVAHVGVGLAREHRIARLAVHLRALHFAVPVRALDQAHGNAAAGAAREVGEEIDHERRALLVRLHARP